MRSLMAKKYNTQDVRRERVSSIHAAPPVIDTSLVAQAANLTPQERAKFYNRDLDALQGNLGYEFNDKMLLDEALCHSSFAHEHGLYVTNERLEFLGDSVLSFVIARALYKIYPDASEGELTKMRAALVCSQSLIERAVKIKLPDMMLIGKSFKFDTPKSLYEDALEALIGAVTLDGGILAAEKVIKKLFLKISDLQALSEFDYSSLNLNLNINKSKPESKNSNNKNNNIKIKQESNLPNVNSDFKSKLQVWLQARHLPLPEYKLISSTGPDHAPEFLVSAKIYLDKDKELEVKASGTNKKRAEAKAAELLLKELEA
ncbi:MAG: ribonuclease III [Synergistaceae bacterium]|nr:ribonuclease III [Synergistaceae bacterium]